MLLKSLGHLYILSIFNIFSEITFQILILPINKMLTFTNNLFWVCPVLQRKVWTVDVDLNSRIGGSHLLSVSSPGLCIRHIFGFASLECKLKLTGAYILSY